MGPLGAWYELGAFLMVAIKSQVETHHFCEFWWAFTRCQKQSRRRWGSATCDECVDVPAPEKSRLYQEVIAALQATG